MRSSAHLVPLVFIYTYFINEPPATSLYTLSLHDALPIYIPVLAAPMDSVMSPATAIALGRLGGLGVLNLEGLWTRYEDPEPLLAEISTITDDQEATARMQEIYSAPIQPELITKRITEIREAGVPAAGALSPQNTNEYAQSVVDSGVD